MRELPANAIDQFLTDGGVGQALGATDLW